jgi:hypothetical protein
MSERLEPRAYVDELRALEAIIEYNANTREEQK